MRNWIQHNSLTFLVIKQRRKQKQLFMRSWNMDQKSTSTTNSCIKLVSADICTIEDSNPLMPTRLWGRPLIGLSGRYRRRYKAFWSCSFGYVTTFRLSSDAVHWYFSEGKYLEVGPSGRKGKYSLEVRKLHRRRFSSILTSLFRMRYTCVRMPLSKLCTRTDFENLPRIVLPSVCIHIPLFIDIIHLLSIFSCPCICTVMSMAPCIYLHICCGFVLSLVTYLLSVIE